MSISGDRIRELRQLHRMTLDDVARHLGIGRQAVYKYEAGTVTNIPLDNIEKMAELFGVVPGYLAGWTDSPHGDPSADLDAVAESSRVPPPGVDVPEGAVFLRMMGVLSPDDLATLTGIFARAARKLQQEEKKNDP